MGAYVHSEKRRRETVRDLLTQAEQDHYADCPDADLPSRVAAGFLDLLFLVILLSSEEKLINLVLNGLGQLSGAPLIQKSSKALVASVIAFELFSAMVYHVWSSVRFGGTPGKLLLGLRVVRSPEGRSLAVLEAVFREAVGKAILIPVSLGMVAVSMFMRADHRTGYDLLAKTSVKKVRLARREDASSRSNQP